jgi:hypothetical protein
MKLTSTTTSNITEILMRIVEFTERRREILTRNLFDYKNDGFRPYDMPVMEFSTCMTQAVTESVRSDRLLFCDHEHVRFGEGNCFDTEPVIDRTAENLLESDLKQYLQMQIHKLSENLMNNRVAVELLKQKQQHNFR